MEAKRRWFQFSLRDLLALIALVALACAPRLSDDPELAANSSDPREVQRGTQVKGQASSECRPIEFSRPAISRRQQQSPRRRPIPAIIASWSHYL
jgi:hypothetical protein